MESMNKAYVKLLIDTLKKKENLLGRIVVESMKQTSCFKPDDMNENAYNEIYKVKEKLIHEIEGLDDGFESLFERVKVEINENKYLYETEIKEMQSLIKNITDKTFQIQRIENENKAKFEKYIGGQKKKIRDFKVSKKTAATYYQNMMKQSSNLDHMHNYSK